MLWLRQPISAWAYFPRREPSTPRLLKRFSLRPPRHAPAFEGGGVAVFVESKRRVTLHNSGCGMPKILCAPQRTLLLTDGRQCASLDERICALLPRGRLVADLTHILFMRPRRVWFLR